MEQIFREKVSGARADRPRLQRLTDKIGPGDVLIVNRLDRLARSTHDLLNILEVLSTRGVAFRSLADAWADTTTPHGRLMLTVLGGGLAEFERELIRARAKTRGKSMERPPALTPHQREEAAQALRRGRGEPGGARAALQRQPEHVFPVGRQGGAFAGAAVNRRRHRARRTRLPTRDRGQVPRGRKHPLWQPRPW
jgi:DNA invertase Pin-like site-specific DNA recombinase